jgi:hypothetical protein
VGLLRHGGSVNLGVLQLVRLGVRWAGCFGGGGSPFPIERKGSRGRNGCASLRSPIFLRPCLISIWALASCVHPLLFGSPLRGFGVGFRLGDLCCGALEQESCRGFRSSELPK